MSFLGKEYHFYKHENFDGFLKYLGMPEAHIAAFCKFNPSQKLVKNGDSYTYYTQNPEGPKEVTFKSGDELDDVMGPEKEPVKITYVIDGNVFTQVVKSEKHKVTFKREFNGDELVATITAEKWDGVAKRFYKA